MLIKHSDVINQYVRYHCCIPFGIVKALGLVNGSADKTVPLAGVNGLAAFAAGRVITPTVYVNGKTSGVFGVRGAVPYYSYIAPALAKRQVLTLVFVKKCEQTMRPVLAWPSLFLWQFFCEHSLGRYWH
jgi:hypothetical protein